MMITEFNKRKCLFKEIVKFLSYVSTERRMNKRKRETSSIFSIFSTAICYVIKIFQMHEHKVFVSLYIAKLQFTLKFTFLNRSCCLRKDFLCLCLNKTIKN